MAKRYQRGNQKPDIKDGHAIQWPKDTKGVIRSQISKTDNAIQWPKDTKGVIRSQISKTDMQYNGQKIPKG
jgi:hypothetical protein